MADSNIENKVYIGQNVDGGNVRTDIVQFDVATGETTGDVQTRLAHITSAFIVSDEDVEHGEAWLNSNTTSNHAAGYKGMVHFVDLVGDKTYKLTAKGW